MPPIVLRNPRGGQPAKGTAAWELASHAHDMLATKNACSLQ